MNDDQGSENRQRGGPSATKLMAKLADSIDEDRAVRLRTQLGKKGWIISWLPSLGDLWMARVSTSRFDKTVEAISATRVRAINHGVKVLEHILELQAERLKIKESESQ